MDDNKENQDVLSLSVKAKKQHDIYVHNICHEVIRLNNHKPVPASMLSMAVKKASDKFIKDYYAK